MSTKNKEREQARRRREKWERHVAELRARRQRTWTLVGVILSLLLVGGVVWWALSAAQDPGTDPAAEPTPRATPTPGQYTLPPPSASGLTHASTVKRVGRKATESATVTAPG